MLMRIVVLLLLNLSCVHLWAEKKVIAHHCSPDRQIRNGREVIVGCHCYIIYSNGGIYKYYDKGFRFSEESCGY